MADRKTGTRRVAAAKGGPPTPDTADQTGGAGEAEGDPAVAQDKGERETPVSGDANQPARIFGLRPSRLFFILFLVLVTPTVIFGGASLAKLYDVLNWIYETPPSQAALLLKEKPTSEAELSAFPTRALVALEADVVAYREHRGEALLATRTWLRFMSVLFGSILVTIGAAFILGKISTPRSEVSMEGWDGFKTSFATSSPGLALVILGCVLIPFRNGYDERIDIRDGAIYFSNAPSPLPTAPQPRPRADTPSPDFQEMLEQLRTPGGAK